MPIPRVLEPEVMETAEQAGEYDDMDFSATDQLFAERAAQMAARGVTQVVDIGSGNAKIQLAMCPLLPARVAVCAIEMSAEMLVVALRNRERRGDSAARLHLLRGDAKRLPFADGTISMVTSNSLIHHIPDPRTVFREIARVAADNGSILIRDLVRPESEDALEHLLQTYAAHASPLQQRLFADSLRAALTVEEVRQMMTECGLTGVAVEQITDRHWSAERA